jgi:predicted metalloprotease
VKARLITLFATWLQSPTKEHTTFAKRFLRRLAVLSVLTAALSAATFVGTAKAVNPEQTTVTGVVNYEYWDLDAFWKPLLNYYGKTYTQPGVRYFDYYDPYGRLVDYSTSCGTTSTRHGSQGFYCPSSQTIYLDYRQQQTNLAKFGDGAVGFWLAHEFGHHIQLLYGLNPQVVPNMELQADCFAGTYVHYGILNSYRLAGNDRAEARNQIWALSWTDTDHGTPQQRLNNFDWGYSKFYFPSCINGYY